MREATMKMQHVARVFRDELDSNSAPWTVEEVTLTVVARSRGTSAVK